MRDLTETCQPLLRAGISSGGLNLLIWRRVFWSFLVDFWTIFHFSVIFGVDFSFFSLFSGSATRYTREQEATMYYCPSENRFKAGSPSAPAVEKFILGTRGCTLCKLFLHSSSRPRVGPGCFKTLSKYCHRIYQADVTSPRWSLRFMSQVGPNGTAHLNSSYETSLELVLTFLRGRAGTLPPAST